MMPSIRKYKSFIGIDPGKSGGIAWIRGDGQLLRCTKIPETEIDLWRWLSHCSSASFAVVEKVRTRPGESAKGAFTFGQGYGSLRMALVASGIPFDQVTPQKWIKALGIPSRKPHDRTRMRSLTKGKNKGKMVEERYGGETDSQWKNRLKAQAQQLFPQETITLAKADALLIAEYCRRTYR